MLTKLIFESENFLLKNSGVFPPEFSKPIFIICAPRSGSTFFYHALRRMKNVSSFVGENTPMWIRMFPYNRYKSSEIFYLS